MAQEIFQELNLSEVMGERFGRYSKYIIQERAIPDVRDGLKPVQRRIIYAMYKEGNTYDKAYRKSAKTVGNVIGNYHPHGDSSVYDAMVRLSQDWKIREPLVDMQGNNGSMDGDPAAAMRYTEARLSKIANELTTDLDKDTVDWMLNFDDTEEEPTVLPAQFPNLLVNGATGISAGYATDIPPHNLGEVIDASLHLIDYPNAGLKKLMTFVQGPDFPTGGIIQGREGLEEAYKTGKGKIVVRSKTSIEDLKAGRQQIVIHEIPYDVNKSQMVQQIDDIRINREIEGISEVRDETDKEGLRIVIEIKKEASAEGILTYLLKNTDMQVNYNLNMVAIHNKRPEQLGLQDMLLAYIDFRKQTVIRRTHFLLHKAENRQHIVEGLIRALSILDQLIQTIRQSQNKSDAKKNLMASYDFTERQAEAIVTLQLYRLSNTDVKDLEKEAQELDEKIKSYQLILNDEKELKNVIKKELRQTKKAFASERRSKVEDEVDELKVEKEVLIAEEEVIVTVTKEAYLKRSSTRSFAASDLEDLGLRDNDYPIFAQKMSTLDQLILFTSAGQAINRPVYSLAEAKWKDLGSHLSQDISLEDGEKIVAVFGLDDFTDEMTFVFASQNGYIKRTLASEFEVRKTFKKASYKAMNLKGDDHLIQVAMVTTDAALDVFTAHTGSYGLRYSWEEISEVGANAQGVKSIQLKEDEKVVGFVLFESSTDCAEALLLSQRGAIKKMDLAKFDSSSRNARGLKVFRTLKTHPHELLHLVKVEDPDQEITFITSVGKEESIQAKDLPTVDRQNNGSFIFDEEVDGRVTDIRFNQLEKLEEDA